MLDILSIGFLVPSDTIEHAEFTSDRSLLDADIVLISPDLSSYNTDFPNSHFEGKPNLDSYSSAQFSENMAHWSREINLALAAKKTVIVFVDGIQQVFIDTGQRQYSGTGRNARKTTVVAGRYSLDFLPFGSKGFRASTGSKVSLAKGSDVIKAYWHRFGEISPYRVQFQAENGTPLLVTKDGSSVVGALFRPTSGGHLLVLPAPKFDWDELYEDDELNAVGQQLSKEFELALVDIHRSLQADTAFTPAPAWAQSSQYQLSQEAEILEQDQILLSRIKQLDQERNELLSRLEETRVLKGLLYEQGKPLEQAILKALRILGFEAEGFDDGTTELDAVFTDGNIRCIGEAEGKDNSAVAIGKLSQLIRNIQDDFAKDMIDEPATGVLFGNAFRLTEPEKRAETFTAKCLTSASNNRIALISTVDLYRVTKSLVDEPAPDFAAKCRQSIKDHQGNIVIFPERQSGPSSDSVVNE